MPPPPQPRCYFCGMDGGDASGLRQCEETGCENYVHSSCCTVNCTSPKHYDRSIISTSSPPPSRRHKASSISDIDCTPPHSNSTAPLRRDTFPPSFALDEDDNNNNDDDDGLNHEASSQPQQQQHPRFIPLDQLHNIANARGSRVAKSIGVTLTDGSLGTVYCPSIGGAGRVLQAWGFVNSQIHGRNILLRKRNIKSGVLFERIAFKFDGV
jgi:hypothetical protein